MGHSNGKRWTIEQIEAELGREIALFGRMPSANELARAGKNKLAQAISKRGGYRYWSIRMGVEQKGTETHFAQEWERHEAKFFAALGHPVERQPTRAPFDMMVSGVRVDVKSASWTECANPCGAVTRGYVFAGLKRGETCDLFDLVCQEDGVLIHRFLVPATDARIVTLTITPSSISGSGKYARFKNNLEVLDDLVASRREAS